MPKGAVFLELGLLLLDEVLADERLVLDENDEPNEMIEFGRCNTFVLSAIDDENELRSLGATKNMYESFQLYSLISNYKFLLFTFF